MLWSCEHVTDQRLSQCCSSEVSSKESQGEPVHIVKEMEEQSQASKKKGPLGVALFFQRIRPAIQGPGASSSCKHYTSNTAKSYVKWLWKFYMKTMATVKAMRTSVRRTTVSSEITLCVIEARNLSENTRVEQTHDGSGQPDERNSSSAHTVKEQHAPDKHREIVSFNTNNEFNPLTSTFQAYRILQ